MNKNLSRFAVTLSMSMPSLPAAAASAPVKTRKPGREMPMHDGRRMHGDKP